ncbi:MAG: hypothetical protein PUI86_06755, partial [Bacteroidales bacterium]|nr:hypothetical protein [Bacteroidales bacterium]
GRCEAFSICYAEPQPTLSKGSARREEEKRKAAGFSFSHPEPQPTLSKGSARREQDAAYLI